MRALTIHRPWPWAIVHLPPSHRKGVENRTWPPPPSILGERMAIHAGLHFDAEALDFIAARCPDDGPLPPLRPESHPTGIVGMATVVGYRNSLDEFLHSVHGLRGRVAPRNPWFVGPLGWLLADVVALPEPVVCKGAQGLWTVPAEVEELVLAQLAAARAA